MDKHDPKSIITTTENIYFATKTLNKIKSFFDIFNCSLEII